ncbi:hypothetical protein EDC94DRAFT_645103 [Helicostylum pulchrum]|nr:hypothetical protein EDC94DRAFT_645103 [Helicostylum pulchrum]
MVNTQLNKLRPTTSMTGDDSLPGYRTICDRIDQFKNLQRLIFKIQSRIYLTHFDGLIEKCLPLKELTFKVDSKAIQRPNELESMIRPRPDIHKLDCDWKLICTERQLEYVMRKFSNLQTLIILGTDSEPEVSGPTLIKFVQYVLSTPEFLLRIYVRKEDLLNIVIEFMKTKNGYLQFVLNTGDNEVAHIRFLSGTGRLFRSLRLNKFSTIPDINGEPSKSIDRLYDILRLCPLLEEFTINHAASLLASDHESNYPSLKKLSILNLEHYFSLGFLNSVSSNLPNLCEFSLGLNYTANKKTDIIVINMPYSSLDSLTWHDCTWVNDDNDVEAYIKLKTETGLRYYYCNKHLFLPVDESRYLLATQNARFDINCKGLKEFRRTAYLSYPQYNWIF